MGNLQAVHKFFCQQRAGLQVLIKMTSKADRWRRAEKVLQKIYFLLFFFSLIKNVFHYVFVKFAYLIRMHAISSPWSQNLRRSGTSCLCELPSWAQIRVTENFSF